jgi:hypothetical protein
MAKAVGVPMMIGQNAMTHAPAMPVVVMTMVVMTMVVMTMVMMTVVMMMVMMLALRVGHDRGSQRKRCGGCHNHRSLANQPEHTRHFTRSLG